MWEAFKDFIFWGMNACYGFLHDWGLAIILATVIFRVLLMPLMTKQIKSSYQMQKYQPLLQEMQEKYADDPQRLSEETRKLYSESGFNPVAGCLPLFLQMPIFIAVFQVLRDEMGWRVGADTGYNFLNIIADLTLSPQSALEQGMAVFVPYIILLLLFAGLTFLPMLLMQRGQQGQQQQTMIIMSVVMTVMMLFIGWGSPGGVLLFWATSSLFGVLQQQILTRVLKKDDAEREEEIASVSPVTVNIDRKERKKRQTKKR